MHIATNEKKNLRIIRQAKFYAFRSAPKFKKKSMELSWGHLDEISGDKKWQSSNKLELYQIDKYNF